MGHDRERSGADRTPHVQIRILGPLELSVGDRRADLPGGRAQIVLATLALHAGQVVSAERLIDAAWGSHPPASVRTQLQALVGALRVALPAGPTKIETRPPGYLLAGGTDSVDLPVFQGSVAAARAAREAGRAADAAACLERALAAWRGPAFEGLGSEYLEAQAQALHGVRVQAFEDLAAVLFELGRHAEVVASAEVWVRTQPLRESLRGVLMRALAGSGRPAEALAVFQDSRAVLISELGVEPGVDLRRVHEEILNETGVAPAAPAPVTVRAAVPAQLPPDLSDFTGRGSEIVDLAEHLAAAARGGPVVISAIAGAGGIGKTTLAVHAGHRMRADFADGQLYVNLRGTSASPLAPAEALARFLRALGTEDARIPRDVEERAAAYRTALADRRVLVILDDARDAAQVRPLLPGDPGCGVVITSRSRLPGLDGASRLDLDVLSPADAEAMFARIVGASVVAADPKSVAAILASCAGLPLAIRIAAARLQAQPSWTVATLAAELADRRHLLDELRIEDRAVRASFALSHAYLDAETARAFALLGLWTGPHLPPAAAAALLDRDERATRRVLDALVGAHLYGCTEPDRYRFHDLLAVYAAEQAESSLTPAQRQEAIGRVVRWYLSAATAAAAHLEPGQRRVEPPLTRDFGDLMPDYDAAFTWCRRQRPNLIAAVELAAAGGYDTESWQIAAMARAYYHRASQWSDWETTHETALAAAVRVGDPFAEAWVRNNYGILRLRTRRLEAGLADMKRAEQLRVRIGDQAGLATTTSNLGNAYLLIAHSHEPPDPPALETAAGYFAASIEMYRAVGDPYGEAVACTNLGATNYNLGRLDIAERHVTAGLELSRRTGNRPSVATALHALAEIATARDQPAVAAGYLRRSLEMKRQLGDAHGAAIVLKDVAAMEQRAGNLPAARTALLEAADLLRFIDPQDAEALRERAAGPG